MKILNLCKKIAQICHSAEELQWENLFIYFIKKIEADDLDIVKKEIKSIYGGMGSFNDLVLQKDGVILALNDKLCTLREGLFEEVTRSA